MAKTSSKNDASPNQMQLQLTKELTSFHEQHTAGEQSKLRIARGESLDRISQIIRNVAAQNDPWQILTAERHCEQFSLTFFAESTKDRQASIQALQTISSLRSTIAAPFSRLLTCARYG